MPRSPTWRSTPSSNGARLSVRDVALATELVYGTLRWQRYLDWILAPHSRRRLASLDARVRVLLRLTAYQLAFLERVPAFAAVNDAVTLARAKPGVAEYVNGVLRSFARRGIREREPAPPADPLEALATRLLVPHVARRPLGRAPRRGEAEALMRALNERPALGIRANTLQAQPRRSGRAPARGRRRCDADAPGAGGRHRRGRRRSRALARLRGRPVRRAGRGLDARGAPAGAGAPARRSPTCAPRPAPRRTHLAQLMDNRGRVLALDPQAGRLGRVAEAAARLGVTIVEAVRRPVETLAPALGGPLRRRARRRAVLESRRAPAQSRGEVAAAAGRRRRPPPRASAASSRRRPRWCDRAAGSSTPPARSSPRRTRTSSRDFLAGDPTFALDPPAAFPVPAGADGFVRCLPHQHGTDGFTARSRSVAARASCGITVP